MQEFLAQTLMTTMEAPSKQRTLLVTPPRRMSTAQASTLATALRSARHGEWTDPVGLSKVADAKADPKANTTVPPASAYPSGLLQQELSTQALREVGRVNSRLHGMLGILTAPARVTAPFGTATRRTVSTAWRDKPSAEGVYQQAIDRYLSELQGAVRITPKNDITLSGQSATIPVTVSNHLQQSVHLRVRLISSQPKRLSVGKPQNLTIGGGHNKQVEFPTSASVNGKVRVRAQLYDHDGKRYGSPRQFTIKVTEVGNSVLLVLGVGLLLVVLAVIRMYRKRAKRHGAQPGPDAPASEASGAQGHTSDTSASPGDDDGPGDDAPAGDDATSDTSAHDEGQDGTDPDEKVGR